jgi:hypothetical protein
MASAGAKFDTNNSTMSEAEAGPVDMDSDTKAHTGVEEGVVSPVMDMDEPVAQVDPIAFEDDGSMMENQAQQELELESPEPAQDQAEQKPESEATEEQPDYMQALAQNQAQMQEYMRAQQEQAYRAQLADQQEKERQQEAYLGSAEYVTSICEQNGLDAEDPVHRQLIQTRLDMHRQGQDYEQRMRQLEKHAQFTSAEQTRQTQMGRLESDFNDAASQYRASEEVVEAARGQARLLVEQGMAPKRAVAESIKFVRLASKSAPVARKQSGSDKQSRIDQINSAGPGRGARSHRKPEMSMAEADMLVSRGGFFPS